ncbi:MAG: O-antigen ligase family protein [Acholeplasmataceae bacterium]|nr:O-antigen ligase family protein [Acholeplasmataceae bacterium]
MHRIEQFLKSGWYIGLIFSATLFAWLFYQDAPVHGFNVYNMVGMLFLLSSMTLVLSLFKNTLYAVPIIFGLFFIISNNQIDFDTLSNSWFPYLALGIFFLGPLVHVIRFRPKIRFGILTLGLFLIALSYVIPLIYTPFDIRAIPISFVAFGYLIIYLFFANTTKGNVNHLMLILLIANLFLATQVYIYIYRGFHRFPELDFYRRLFVGWGRNLGWGNINDVGFYLALTLPSYFYFVFKYPKKLIYWIILLFPVFAIILTKSRGGMIGFSVSFFLCVAYTFLRGKKEIIYRGLIAFAIGLVLLAINYEIIVIWWEYFVDSFGADLNDFSSSRIVIYQAGLEVFRQYPFFGGGWLSIESIGFDGRLFMYHSTIVQALAAMGLFGLAALLVHFFQIFRFVFSDITLEKKLFMIGFLASQVHGLIDNVQYAVQYSVLIVLVFAVWETASKDSIFKKVDHKYITV